MNNYDKIKGFIYTEKSNKAMIGNKYYFKIDSLCKKDEVKSLIKSIFGVEVTKVNIANTTGKTKRFKGVSGKRASYKKAIVTLKAGQSINLQELK